jgi:hypothetical protein
MLGMGYLIEVQIVEYKSPDVFSTTRQAKKVQASSRCSEGEVTIHWSSKTEKIVDYVSSPRLYTLQSMFDPVDMLRQNTEYLTSVLKVKRRKPYVFSVTQRT